MLREKLLSNERIVNQANYLLTALTTLLIAVVSTSVQTNIQHVMFYPLLMAWCIVFLLRLTEKYFEFITQQKTQTQQQSIKPEDYNPAALRDRV